MTDPIQAEGEPASERGLLVAALLAITAGSLGGLTMPFTNSALVIGDLGLEADRVGVLTAIEMLALALTTLACAARVDRLSPRRLVFVGAAVQIVGYGLAALSGDWASLALARLTMGCGQGVITAAVLALLSGTRNPDRSYALGYLTVGLAAAGIMLLLPLAISWAGYRGGFASLGLLCLLPLPFYRWLPSAPLFSSAPSTSDMSTPDMSTSDMSNPDTSTADTSTADTSSEANPSPPPTPSTPLSAPRNAAAPLAVGGGILLLGVLVHTSSDQVLWSISAEIARAGGVDLERYGYIGAAGQIASLLGSGLAVVLAARFGRTLPLLVGLLALAVSRFYFTQGESFDDFLFSSLLWAPAYFFVGPYLMGTAAALDPSGRIPAAAGAMTSFGAALGPLAGGFVWLQLGSLGIAAIVTTVPFLIALILLPTLRRLDRSLAVENSRTRKRRG